MIYADEDYLIENQDKIEWWKIGVEHMPLEIIREFIDKVSTTSSFSIGMSIYKIFKYNKYVDFDFIREMTLYFNNRIDIKEVISIIDSKGYKQKYINELLRMWVDWNVKNKTKGFY